MNSEQQYIDLYRDTREQICAHSADALNAVRDAAFADFERLGFPSRKVERYKYTTIDKLFEPNYGLNINRIEVQVDPYKAFRCDVPNLSTSLYFIVNDQFRQALQPKDNLPEGIGRRLPTMPSRILSSWQNITPVWQRPTRTASPLQHYVGTGRAAGVRQEECRCRQDSAGD